MIKSFSDAGFNVKAWLRNVNFTIRNQIHSTVLLVTLVSFIIIGITTIFIFREYYQSNSRNQISNTLQSIEQEIQQALTDSLDGNMEIYAAVKDPRIVNIISKQSEIHNSTINVFDLSLIHI